MPYDVQLWVLGGGHAKPSNTEGKDGRTLPPPLTSRNQAMIQVIHAQSHCAVRPARRNSGPMWTRELHSGTRTFALLARKQYLRRRLTSQSYMAPLHRYCPLFGSTFHGPPRDQRHSVYVLFQLPSTLCRHLLEEYRRL